MSRVKLLRDEYREAVSLRKNPANSACLILYNLRGVVGVGDVDENFRHYVTIENNLIQRVGTHVRVDDLRRELISEMCDGFKGQIVASSDCESLVLMPGLCDCHVHCTACTANLPGLLALPESLTTARAGVVLENMLLRGFTTVRDAGGADWGLAQAVEEGVIVGPRLLFTGHALSQTGGHGDMRGKGEDCVACGAALRGIGRTCDGDAEVRKAARDELRKGAHCVKVMASGGVSSPTDKLSSTQFSEAELRAIVEEAEACGSYVAAHAYTSRAIARCVSVEHGNHLDGPTAHMMKEEGAFLVPTLVTYEQLALRGAQAGLAAELCAKVGDLLQRGLEAIRTAEQAEVDICFGSDLLGQMHDCQSDEFRIRAEVQTPAALIAGATTTAARLFGLQDRIGKVQQGFEADLILLRSDPRSHVDALAHPASSLAGVIKAGVFAARSPDLQLRELRIA